MSPAQDTSSYHMPAEWEPHEATWIAWPHNKEHWPGNFGPIPAVFAQMVRALQHGEKVYICVNDAAMEAGARQLIGDCTNVQFFHIPTDASWSRDHGPIFVRDAAEKLTITDWIFNAWGEKYAPWDKDDAVPQRIAEIFKMPIVQPGIVMEGGSIDVNGKGTLITTEQCLLNKNRNLHLSREQIEKYLHDYLGAKHILWLKEGIVGDDTDGHIDDIARFVNPKTVVCALEDNTNDENFEILRKNYEDLQDMNDQDGKPLNIITIPMPEPVIYQEQRLPASYANFYIGNKVILLPTFRCTQDKEAQSVLEEVFPGRKVVPIDCIDLIWGLGMFHCSTQQQPA